MQLGRQNLHLFRLKNTRFDVIGGMFYFCLVVSLHLCQHCKFSSLPMVQHSGTALLSSASLQCVNWQLCDLPEAWSLHISAGNAIHSARACLVNEQRKVQNVRLQPYDVRRPHYESELFGLAASHSIGVLMPAALLSISTLCLQVSVLPRCTGVSAVLDAHSLTEALQVYYLPNPSLIRFTHP